MTERMEAIPSPIQMRFRFQVYGVTASLLFLLLVSTFLLLGGGTRSSTRGGEMVRLLLDLSRNMGRLEGIRLQQLLLLEQALHAPGSDDTRTQFQKISVEAGKLSASLQAGMKKMHHQVATPDMAREGQRISQHIIATEKGLRGLAEQGIQVLDRVHQNDLERGRRALEEITKQYGSPFKDWEQAQAATSSWASQLAGAIPPVKDKIKILSWLLLFFGVVIGVGITWWVVRQHERALSGFSPSRQDLALPAAGKGAPMGRISEKGGFPPQRHEMIEGIEARLSQLEILSEPLQSLASNLSSHVQEMTRGAKKAIYDASEMRTNMTTINAWAEESNEHMHVISNSADESSQNMQSINKASEDANTALKMVAESSEQASISMNSVRDAAERTNRNLNEVARSVEELNRSLMEVRKQCEAADKESEQASHNARNNSEVMANLAKAAQEIGKVIELINEIADQTNMLALNASIEAAGAGDAGKGFAVVANEVKELARQTTDAIRLVGDSVDEIQEKTSEATKAAHEMARNIERISQSNREILHTVDSQSNNIQAVAKAMEAVALENSEVTRLVGESSGGISEMSRNVNEISEGIAEVTRNVTEATEGIHRMSTGVGEIARGNIENSQNVGDAASSTTGVISSMEMVHTTAEKVGEMGNGVTTLAEGLNNTIRELRQILGATQG
ncbi:MAG: hypothetical protein HQL63_12005 [Magnetococcales bacterium]|nr:hypothetical protein [Magnetococcales bacterium]